MSIEHLKGNMEPNMAGQTRILKFTPYAAPIPNGVSVEKFGGLPVGFEQKDWPSSPTTLKPMTFVCQFRLNPVISDADSDLFGYFFMSPTGDHQNECLFDVEDFRKSESRLVISRHQGNMVLAKGPSLPVELRVTWVEVIDKNSYGDPLVTSKVGGKPGWVQDDETPIGPQGLPLEFFAQISSEDVGESSVEHHFVDSNIYLFVSSDLRFGQAIWQFS